MPNTEMRAAGRELDAEIADKVMGWTEINRIGAHGWRGTTPEGDREKIEFYSTDIAAAWEVVEKIGLLDARPDLDNDAGLALQRNDSGEWEVKFRFGLAIARAETVPLAICLAALKTVEGR